LTRKRREKKKHTKNRPRKDLVLTAIFQIFRDKEVRGRNSEENVSAKGEFHILHWDCGRRIIAGRGVVSTVRRPS